MLRIQNIKLPVDYREKDLRKTCEQLLRRKDLPEVMILKRSLDARKKDQIHYHITAGITGFSRREEERILRQVHNKNIMLTERKKYRFPCTAREGIPSPVIIGTGPAGYFAGLMLSRAGFHPILLERGKSVEERKADVDRLWEEGQLNTESNVSFGEGGAGTFSDGKLYTGNSDKDGTQSFVLETFSEFGADRRITYDAKPHIGTDVLYTIMQNLRKEIRDAGGEIRFQHKVTDIRETGDGDWQIRVEAPEGEYSLETGAVILAIGHSARDTFGMLDRRGFSMEKKPFAVGLRMEHPRKLIDRARYGDAADKLPAADYKVTFHTTEGRSVFSFCMCPGGYVVNASTEEGGIVVNGMSYSGRNGENSNSAIVVNILPEDIPGDSPMDAVRFQRELEQGFYREGRGLIPVQRYEDFCSNRSTTAFGSVQPQIMGRYTTANLRNCLPDEVARAIMEAVPGFEREIPGFALPDAVLSGIESRTSSPVRILRGNDLMAEGRPGFFPCGEGAGYAGGITSAAVDGIHVAEAVARYLGCEG